jgi:hypothetical protein
VLIASRDRLHDDELSAPQTKSWQWGWVRLACGIRRFADACVCLCVCAVARSRAILHSTAG